jgi:hypothetical protein
MNPLLWIPTPFGIFNAWVNGIAQRKVYVVCFRGLLRGEVLEVVES